MLIEDRDAEPGLLFVGDALAESGGGLGAVGVEVGFGDGIAPEVVPVIGSANDSVGEDFRLAVIEGHGCRSAVHDLNPVDPQGELRPDAVAPESFAEDLQGSFIGVEGAAFAEEEPATSSGSDRHGDFQYLRLIHRAGHCVRAGDRAVHRAELDEMP